MADPNPQQQIGESTSTTVTTVTEDPQEQEQPVRVKLRKPKTRKAVQWTTDTVDNEHMNRKKSKCCCIYEKPKKNFDDSSSDESDDECDHCQGHVEKRKKPSQASTSQDVPSTSQIEENPTQVVTMAPEENDILDSLHIVLKPSNDPPN